MARIGSSSAPALRHDHGRSTRTMTGESRMGHGLLFGQHTLELLDARVSYDTELRAYDDNAHPT